MNLSRSEFRDLKFNWADFYPPASFFLTLTFSKTSQQTAELTSGNRSLVLEVKAS